MMFREMRRRRQALPEGECVAILERMTSGVLAVEGDVAAVQVAGYMRFPCADALTVGYAQLSLDASGELAAGSGRGGLVTDISGGTCGVIFC